MTAKEKASPQEELAEQPLISHLVELRDRVLRSFVAVIVLFLLLIYWRNDIYTFVSEPLRAVLDAHIRVDDAGLPAVTSEDGMITTKPLDAFMIPLKLTFMVALFACIPYILHQAWAFISPGLYKHEIKVTFPIIVSSVLLFYTGMAFSYYVVLGFMFRFFVGSTPEGVTVAIDIAAYLDTVMGLFLAFGLVFEVPVALVLLVISGVITPAWLVEKRSYAIIVNFAIAMVVTPSDAYSMILMAIPMCVLYEVGIIASRIFYKARLEKEAQEESA
jgi:sec-independent protein translocase protein TatC